MKFSKLVSAVTALVISSSAHASFINTINGNDYEWLEVSETRGLSRDQVDTMLNDSNSSLFGYQYATRLEAQELLLSYAPWDGVNGLHGNPEAVTGLAELAIIVRQLGKW